MTAPHTPLVTEYEREFAVAVDRLAQQPGGALLSLCDERHEVYTNQSAPAIARMRGWVLEALERLPPLDDAAIPFVLEELEAPSHPYLLTVAARCLRAAGRPHASFAPALAQAFRAAPALDAPVTLGSYGGLGGAAVTSTTSPVRELVATIGWMGPLAASLAEDLQDAVRSSSASPEVLLVMESVLAGLPAPASKECCAELPEPIARLVHWRTVSRRGVDAALDRVTLEDQRGTTSSFRGLFSSGQPTIVTFFYTRCDNPFKCTLTVAKLGRVQRLLQARGLEEWVRTVGISYDAQFDTPAQLSRYGHDRGLRLNARHVLVRATSGFDELKRHFALGVTFFESLVSRHRIDVFVLDHNGRIASTFCRLNWSEEQVVDEAAALVGSRQSRPLSSMTSLLGLAALALPKCPLCWATYASVLGFSGVLAFPDPRALQAVAMVLLLVYLGGMFWRAHRTSWRPEHVLAGGGAAMAIFNTLFVSADAPTPPFVWISASLMAAASIVSVARRPT
jgi:protein SCO1/2